MRQSAGEANITIIVIVLIGVIAVGGAIIIPKLLKNTDKGTCCELDDGVYYDNQCYKASSCTRDSISGRVLNCTVKLQPNCKK